MSNDKEWIEMLHFQLEIHIQDLAFEFGALLTEECLRKEIPCSKFPDVSDIYLTTPDNLWTPKMHDIYGQARTLNMITDLLGTRVQSSPPTWKQFKPLLIGKR